MMEQNGDSREQRVLSLRHGRHRTARTNSTSAIPPPTGTHHSNTMLSMTEATTNNSSIGNVRPEDKGDPLASTFTEMQQTLKDRGQQQSTAPSASSVRDASLLLLTRNERGRVVPSSHSLVQHPPQPPLSLTSPSAPRGGGEMNIITTTGSTGSSTGKGSNVPVGSYAPHGEPCNVAPRRLPQLTRLNETVEPTSLPLPRHTPPQQQQQKETAVNTNYNTTTSSSTQPTTTTSNIVVASSPPLRPSARVLTRCPSSGPACLPPRRRTRSCMWAMPEFHSTHHSSFTSGSSGGMTTATYVNVPEAGSGFLRVKLYNNTTTNSTSNEKHGQWCLVPNTVSYEEFCQLIRQRCEATQGGSNHNTVVSFTNASTGAAADSTSAEEVSAGALASHGSPRKPVSAAVMSGLPASPTVQAAMKLYYTVDGGVAPGTSQATNSASTNSNNTTSNITNSNSSNGMTLLDKAEFARLTQARGPGLSFGALNIHIFAGGSAEPEAEQAQQQQQRSSLHASLLQRSDSLSNTAKSQPEMSHTTSMSLAQTAPPPATTTTTTTTHTPPRSVHDVYLSSKRNSEGGHGGNITRGTNMQQILSSSLEGGLNLSNMMLANSTSIENGLSWYNNNSNNNTNTSSGAQVRTARHHERHPHYSQEVRNSLSLPSNTPKTDNVHGRLSQSSGGNGMYLSLLKEKLELQHTHHHNNNNINTASHGGPNSHTTSHAKTPYTTEKINALSGTHTPGYNNNTNTTARHALESDRMSDVVNGLDSSSDEESKDVLHTEKDEVMMMMRPLRSALQSNNNNNSASQPSLLMFPQRLNSAPVVRTTNTNTTNNTSNSSGNGEAAGVAATSYMPLYTEGRGHHNNNRNNNNVHVSEAAEVPLEGVLRHAHFFTLQAPEEQQAPPQQIEARTPPHRGMSNKARHRSGHNHTTTTNNEPTTSSNNTATKNSNSKELGHHRTSNRALQVQPTSADERTAIHPAVDEAAAANIVITSAEGGTTATTPNTVMTTMELLGLPAKAPAENKRKKDRSRRTGHNNNNTDTIITTNETGKKESANESRRRGRERTREVTVHHAAHDVESGRMNAEAEPTRMTSPPAPHDTTNNTTTSNISSNNNNVSNVANHCVAVRQRLPSRRPASRPPGPGHSSQSQQQQYGYASPSFGAALGNSTSSAQAMSITNSGRTSYYLPRYDSSEMQWQRTLEALQRSQIVWRRIAVIGKGAYATVYEGVLQDGHHVAVKVLDVPHLTRRDLLSRSGTDDRGGSRRNAGDEMNESAAAAGGGGGLSGPGPSVRRLVREINLMRHLKHPNIVGYIHCQVTKLWTDPIPPPPPPTASSPMQRAPGRIQDWWFDNCNSNNVIVGESGVEGANVKTPYSNNNTNSSSSLLTLRAQPLQVEILMELCPGGSLAQRVRDSPARRLPMPQVRRYIRQVLCGLVYLHERGVIHRDIKADNVLISASGDAKLADFGCSRRIAAAAHGTSGPGCAMCSLRSPRANEDTNNDTTAHREKVNNKERRDEYLDEDCSGSSIGAALLTPKTTLDLSNSTGRAFHHGGAEVSVPQSVLTHQTVQQVAAGVALSQLDNRFMGTVSTLAHTMVGTPLFMAPEVILQDVESSSSCMDKMRDPLMAPSTAASHRIIAPVRFSTDSEQVNMGTLVSELNETEATKKDEKGTEQQGQQSSATNTMSRTESNSSSGGYAAPADVWAVGCLTLELLGRSPWPVQTAYGGALSYIQVILRIARAEKDKLPPGVPTNAPAPLYEFLQRALQRDPRQRATAQELLQLEWMRCPEDALEELT